MVNKAIPTHENQQNQHVQRNKVPLILSKLPHSHAWEYN